MFLNKGKQLVITGRMNAEVIQRELPQVKDDAILLKINVAGICGSDLHNCDNAVEGERRVIGHEFCGTIVAMGIRAKDVMHCYNGELAVGDRVVVYPHVSCRNCDMCLTYGNGVCICDRDYLYGRVPQRPLGILNNDSDQWPFFKGGFAEYIYLFPNTFMWKIPDDMPDEIAVQLDPMATAVRAVENVMSGVGGQNEGVNTTSTCLVIGAGPIGVMTGMYLKSIGVERLIMSDFLDQKLEKAREICNADLLLNMSGLTVEQQVQKVMEVTNGKGADIVISCANSALAAVGGLQMTKKLGHYVELGCISTRFGGKELSVNFHDLVFSRSVHISSVIAVTPSTFDKAFRYLQRWKELPFEKLITHRFYDLEEFIPHVKKMSQPDYMKGVMFFKREFEEEKQ